MSSTITITLAAVLAERAGGEKSIQVEGATVEEALRDLTKKQPGLEPLLWRKSGEFNPLLVLFCNNKDVRGMDGLNTTLQPGDELAVISALEGG